MLWLLGSAETKTSTEQALRMVSNDDMDLVFSSWPLSTLHLDACTFFATTSNNCLYITSMAYLGGGFKDFLFLPLFGEDSHFD